MDRANNQTFKLSPFKQSSIMATSAKVSFDAVTYYVGTHKSGFNIGIQVNRNGDSFGIGLTETKQPYNVYKPFKLERYAANGQDIGKYLCEQFKLTAVRSVGRSVDLKSFRDSYDSVAHAATIEAIDAMAKDGMDKAIEYIGEKRAHNARENAALLAKQRALLKPVKPAKDAAKEQALKDAKEALKSYERTLRELNRSLADLVKLEQRGVILADAKKKLQADVKAAEGKVDAAKKAVESFS